jgi:hypothetical protein
MNIAANSAKFIFYHACFRSSVPVAETPELVPGDSTYTGVLAADLLLIQQAAGTAQPWIALDLPRSVPGNDAGFFRVGVREAQ